MVHGAIVDCEELVEVMRETRALDYSYDVIETREAKKRSLHRRVVQLLLVRGLPAPPSMQPNLIPHPPAYAL